jgi:hypothetical protein
MPFKPAFLKPDVANPIIPLVFPLKPRRFFADTHRFKTMTFAE